MSYFLRIIMFFLMTSLVACVSNPLHTVAADDEDKDIGLGGTGLLANTTSDTGNGLGGTGLLGEITGFGSIFVNGIEVEYDSETPFTIDGKASAYQPLEIGDVIEVLTLDASNHTQARQINLRHEVIGRVDSVEAETFSFTIRGQSIIQAIDKASLPEVGARVAVSGFRINEQTIVSTRVTPADAKQTLLRTHTALPFREKATRWRVQTHVQNNKAVFQLDGVTHVLNMKEKTERSFADRLGIMILQLQKPATGQLKLEQVIEPMKMPRGQPASTTEPGGNRLLKNMPGSIPGTQPGTGQINLEIQPEIRGKF